MLSKILVKLAIVLGAVPIENSDTRGLTYSVILSKPAGGCSLIGNKEVMGEDVPRRDVGSAILVETLNIFCTFIIPFQR